MNLIPWRKKHTIPVARESALSTPISEFRGEMDRLFERFLHGTWMHPSTWSEDLERATGKFMPTIDVAESDQQITVRAEIPGMKPEDVDISLSGNVLTIHGEKKESTEETDDDFYHCERCFGSFSRSIELPSTADLDEVEAEQRNGVLTVGIKKLATAQAKKIDVKAPREMANAAF